MGNPVDLTVEGRRNRGGLSRRNFLQAMGVVAAALGVPESELMAAFTASLAKTPRLPVVWFEFAGCTGDTESLLRAAERTDPAQGSLTDPSIIDLLLDVISLDYHETVMAPAGVQSEKSLNDTIAKYPGKYVVVVEGAIPTGLNGAFCIIGGKSAVSIAQRVCKSAAATIALGNCAAFGGLPAANPNPTAAKSVSAAVPGLNNVVNIPGCPANVVNFVATVVYFIANGRFPPLDSLRRPTFAFGKTVHSQCPRQGHYEDGPWTNSWGDAAHRSQGCMVHMGCRGPITRANCPSVKWNGGASWPVQAGHGCIGCTEPGFWDNNFPYYKNPLPADD